MRCGTSDTPCDTLIITARKVRAKFSGEPTLEPQSHSINRQGERDGRPFAGFRFVYLTLISS